MNIDFDKSDWKKTKLDDVVFWYQKNIPNESMGSEGISNYVVSNHIDSDSFIFSRHGLLSDGQKGPTVTKHFEKGDFLISTRSVALRKAALAPISGVTGEKLLVLRVKENSDLIPELLPFICHSNDFWKYAQNSASGSVNKFTSWTKLRDYEFLLPPKEQQAEVAELLWSMDELIQKKNCLRHKAEQTLSSEIENGIHGERLAGRTIGQVLEELSNKIEMVSLAACGEILKGKGIPKKDVVEAGVPCIRYGELYTSHHRIIRKYKSFISSGTTASAFKLEKNDVLFAGSGETIAEIGKSAAFMFDDDAYAGGDILVFRPDSMNGKFLGYLMNSQLVRQQLNKLGTGATVMHIYRDDLQKIKIPKIEYEQQVEIGKHLESYAARISFVEKNIASSKTLQKSLINQVF